MLKKNKIRKEEDAKMVVHEEKIRSRNYKRH
jgi:hypothetical protein